MVPNCVVLVATVRALKMHGGVGRIVPGKPLPDELIREDLEHLEAGCANLVAHIGIARQFGVPVVVCVNRFTPDTDAEIDLIRRVAMDAGAVDAVASDHWAHGGAGGAGSGRGGGQSLRTAR